MSSETSPSSGGNSVRNQRLFVIVFALLLAYTFLELWNFYADQRARVSTSSELIELLYGPETALIRASSSRQASNPSGQPLATVATVTAGQHEIQFARFEPISEEVIKIWFEDIQYERLATWLTQLEYIEGISTASLNVERGNAQGTI
ncbi:MAG: type II secretion system protein M, partial [Proteobacteria bacterium]|nr:type II secretion system protein M [Pseudomonadota bacterium]